MSAAALGERLLSEVKEESLDQLLRPIRETVNPPNIELGIPSLDKIINVFQNPSPTRQQEIYRDRGTTDTSPPHSTKANPPLVLEITGSSTCSGKTQLLYYIISIALLPPTIHNIPLHGKGEAAILLDLSGRFSILRLREIMHHIILTRLSSSSPLSNTDDIDALIADSLLHLHVFQPPSTPSLLATLASIPSYLLARPPTHSSSSRRLGLIALSDLSSFLYQDRLESETAAMEAAGSGVGGGATNELLNQRYSGIVGRLREIHTVGAPTIVATTSALAPVSRVMGQRALRPPLPAAWTGFVGVSVVVGRERVGKLERETGVEEAEGEREEVTEKREGRFGGWVNWWGAEGWREGVREGLGELRARGSGGRFGFVVGEGGVDVDVDHDQVQ